MAVVVSSEMGGGEVPDWISPADLARCPPRPADPWCNLLAHDIASLLGGVAVVNKTDPRIVNVSKSIQHRSVISPPLKPLRSRIESELHQPYVEQVRDACLRALMRRPFVIHLSIRTFSPIDRRGNWQRGDVGLSYDPKNVEQLDLVLDWIDQMYDFAWMLKVRRNHPVAGTVEDITHQMQRLFETGYVGLGVHFNRNWISRTGTLVDEAFEGMFAALSEVLRWSDADAA